MNYILDLIILAIIALFVVISAKKGFVKTVIEFAGLILAIYLAVTLSTPLADFTYNKAVEPLVVNTINDTLEDVSNSAETVIKDSIYQSLPKFISNNIDFSEFNIEPGEDIALKLSNNFVKPISISILKAIYTLILFIILNIIIKFLANVLNKLFSFSVVGSANKILGGVLGFVKGIIFAVVFVIITKIIISFSGGFLIFTQSAVDNSILFSLIAEILPASFLI